MPKYLTAREIREKFEVAFTLHQADALSEVMSAIETERVAEMAEIRENLTTLVEVTTRLAQAQQRTEKRVEQLAQAQARTDESIKTLTQAQARTDESIKTLTQAQARTDERLTRVELAVEKLADAQARTEQVVADTRADILHMREALTRSEARIVDLQQTVGKFGNQLGFDLEEYTSYLLPPYLQSHFELDVQGLGRDHFLMEDGSRAEVDLVGYATRNGEDVLVLAECRTQVGGGAIRELAKKLSAIEQTMPRRKIFKCIVAMRTHPTAREAAQELGIALLPYTQLNREYFSQNPSSG